MHYFTVYRVGLLVTLAQLSPIFIRRLDLLTLPRATDSRLQFCQMTDPIRVTNFCIAFSDVKRGQKLESEIEGEPRTLRPRPRPRPGHWRQDRGLFLEVDAKPRPKIKLRIKSTKWWRQH